MSSQLPQPDLAKTRMYSGVPQEERARLRRARLIEAGVEVFGTLGLAQATMRDICVQSRLSERYFYESFRSTREVFDAVHQQLVLEVMAAIRGGVMQAPLSERGLLESGLRAFLRFIQEDPRRVQIVLIDGVWLKQTRGRSGQSELLAYQQVILTLVQGLHPKVSPDIDLALAASGLIGTAIHSAIAWAHAGFKADLESVIQHNLSAWGGLRRWMSMTVPGSEVVSEQKELVEHVRQAFSTGQR
jgi:AcrR family transcriptional regulator